MAETKAKSSAPEKAAKPAAASMASKSAAKPGKRTGEKRVRRVVPKANIFISASYNNTLMTMTDLEGKVLCWASAGAGGFKGSRKATPYAATVTAEKLAEKAQPYGVQSVRVYVNGVGVGREQAIRGLQAAGYELEAIFDTTPVPHNGVRKRKSRRV